MTDLEALNLAVARTGVERYRHLCSPANTLPSPNDPATWRRFMHTLASGQPPQIVVDYSPVIPSQPCGSCP